MVNSIENHTTWFLTDLILASNWARPTNFFLQERETINLHDEVKIALIVQLD